MSKISVLKNTAAVGAGSSLWLPLSYSVDKYIRRQSSRLHTCRFAVLPAHFTLAVIAGRVSCETAPAGWRCL